MAKSLRRPLSLLLGALATTSLGGCYYGDVNGAHSGSYTNNDCRTRYGDAYYDYDPYAYDDGYGYDCYDGGDYGSGFVNIGFGGGWYDNYYYPGSGLWMFDSYRNRYPLRGQYLNYWGGRRAWWKHHGKDPNWRWRGRDHDGPRGDGRPGRPGGWDRDRDHDGPHGTRPGRPGVGQGNPPTTTNPVRPGRPGGWDRDRGNDGPHGTRPGRPGAGNGNNPPPAITPGRPGRPDRGPGAGRPRPPQDGAGGVNRPPPQWQGRPGDGSAGAPPRPHRPQASSPARPAPAIRPAPSLPAASAPPQSRPTPSRPSRADRPNKVREQ